MMSRKTREPFLRSVLRWSMSPLLVACLTISCTARKPLILPPEPLSKRISTADEAREALLKNYGRVCTMRASGEIEVRLSEEESGRKAFVSLMLERPEKFRIRAYRRPFPTVFELVSDGRECWLFLPSERTAYRNDCRNAFRVGDDVSFSSNTFVSAIFVLTDLDELAFEPLLVRRDGELVKLALMETNGGRKDLWINSATGLAERQLFVGSDGNTKADIRYLEYAFDQDRPVPIEVSINIPMMRASVILRIDSFRLDTEIPPEAFEFLPMAGVTVRETGKIDPDAWNGR